MGWRIVVLTSPCRLNYKNNFLIVRNEEMKMIHLSEINTIVLENSQISLSNYLINELIKNKIQLITCDERHNPSGEIMPYYASYNSPKRIALQFRWAEERKKLLHTLIIRNKIDNQRKLLKHFDKLAESSMLESYVQELQFNDETNREGHAAKVYFNALFTKNFTRGSNTDVNAMLDYGYTILMSCFNREIAVQGYLTQFGINHRNEFNQFNLSCDLMEAFRVLVDEIALNHVEEEFSKSLRVELIDVLNVKKFYEGKEQYLSNIIRRYVENCISFMNDENANYVPFEYEL